MSEVTHDEIHRRVEKVEIQVAVLDNKTERLHTDLVDLKADVKANGLVSRDIQTKLNSIPRFITVIVIVAGFLITMINHFDKVPL